MGLDRGERRLLSTSAGTLRWRLYRQGSIASHNARLLEHLDRQRIAAWPFSGPIPWRKKQSAQSMSSQRSNITWWTSGRGRVVLQRPIRPRPHYKNLRASPLTATPIALFIAPCSKAVLHCAMHEITRYSLTRYWRHGRYPRERRLVQTRSSLG